MKGLKLKIPKEIPKTHNYGKLITFYCAKCGKQLIALYETDSQRGGGICTEWRYCQYCGNRLDFGEYYCKEDKDELVLED